MNEWLSKEAKFQEHDLELAREFANENSDKFDDEWISKLEKDFARNGYLTEKQYISLRNVIEKWRMEEWSERQ